MIQLKLAGAHTHLLSTLCASCPQGVTGCCKSPPEVDWADIGRVVALGGRDWLLAEIAAGNLVPFNGGLRLRRERRRSSITEPRTARCVYHGPEGCSIDPSRRPATCNYFLCEDAFVDGGERRGDPAAKAAREAHGALCRQYSDLNDQFKEIVRAAAPEGPPWDAAFLDMLGGAFEERTRAPAFSQLGSVAPHDHAAEPR